MYSTVNQPGFLLHFLDSHHSSCASWPTMTLITPPGYFKLFPFLGTFFLTHMSDIQVFLVSSVCSAGQPYVCLWSKNFNFGHDVQTFWLDSLISAMLKSTIGLYHFVPLALDWGWHVGSRICWGHFLTHFLANMTRIKFRGFQARMIYLKHFM